VIPVLNKPRRSPGKGVTSHPGVPRKKLERRDFRGEGRGKSKTRVVKIRKLP